MCFPWQWIKLVVACLLCFLLADPGLPHLAWPILFKINRTVIGTLLIAIIVPSGKSLFPLGIILELYLAMAHTYASPPISESNGNQIKISYQLANSMTTQFALGDMFDYTTKSGAVQLDEAPTLL
jgi:hypothetical protein